MQLWHGGVFHTTTTARTAQRYRRMQKSPDTAHDIHRHDCVVSILKIQENQNENKMRPTKKTNGFYDFVLGPKPKPGIQNDFG